MKRGDKMNVSKEKIERLMVNRGLTPSELAKTAGVSQEGLSLLRRRGTCRLSTAIKLCQALKCQVEEIIPTESEVRT